MISQKSGAGKFATHFWSHKHGVLVTTAVMASYSAASLIQWPTCWAKSKSLCHLSFDSVDVKKLQMLLLNLWLLIDNSYPSLDTNGSMLQLDWNSTITSFMSQSLLSGVKSTATFKHLSKTENWLMDSWTHSYTFLDGDQAAMLI